jgi:hypothetical protein
MKTICKIPLIILGAALAFFVVTFGIYFFNLDMKAMTLVEPFLLKHYDNMPRKTFL